MRVLPGFTPFSRGQIENEVFARKCTKMHGPSESNILEDALH